MNAGAASLKGGATLQVRSGEEGLWSHVYDKPLAAGEASEPLFAVIDAGVVAEGVVVVVDPEGLVRECDEDNEVEVQFACR